MSEGKVRFEERTIKAKGDGDWRQKWRDGKYNVNANYRRRAQKSQAKDVRGEQKDFETLSNIITVIMLLFFPL
jgi:hypothetical protein